MMQEQHFSKAAVKDLRTKMQEALDGLFLKTGIQLKVGNCTFDAMTADFKVKAIAMGEDGKPHDPEAEAFLHNAHLWGLKPEDLGREFDFRGETHRVAGLKTRSRKYPFLVERVRDGRRLKFTDQLLKLHINFPQVPALDPDFRTPCCKATVTIDTDSGATNCRSCHQEVG